MTSFFKNIIPLVSLLAFCWSCNDDKITTSKPVTPTKTITSPVVIDSSKILLVHEKHENGNTKFYGTAYDTVYHGYCKTFFLNETISSQGNYVLGLKEGWWEYFHDNGQLQECGHYSANLQTGTWKYFNYYGSLVTETNFYEGEQNGWEKKYVNDTLIEECEYRFGKKEGYYHLYENGILILKGNYFNNAKVGVWKTFNNKGKIVHEEDFG